MKRPFLTVALLASLVMTGCASLSSIGLGHDAGAAGEQPAMQATTSLATASSPEQVVVNDGSGDVVVQKVEFRPGVSSSTVERLAKHFGCTGSAGAGLITEKGPVEVYRMKCDNGTTFMARCELRQCQPMR
jgi:hypothetical protein